MTDHPKENGPVPPEITKLLEERETYRTWLGRLEERRTDVRKEVLETVRADYVDRLERVSESLLGHQEELERSVRRRAEKVQELEARRDELLRDREEAELRHVVGELDESEWNERREELDGQIGEVDGELDGERDAVDRLKEALRGIEEGLPELEKSRGPGGGGETPLRLLGEEEREEAAPAEALEAESRDASADEGVGPRADASGATPSAVAPGDAGEEREGPEPGEAEEAEPGEAELTPEGSAQDAYYDELEFLESLSLDDPERFDAVSAMLDTSEEAEEEAGEGGDEEGSGERSP